MATHSKRQILRLVKRYNQHIRSCSLTSVKAENKVKQFQTKPFEEIQIPVPWGYIAGKWYGPKHERPLVGLHGWQDNSGTYDTLAPHLPNNMPFLALDMPGHGLSSWLPEGMVYHSMDNVIIIKRVMDELKWDKISLMGHSMNSMSAFVFAALLPDKVDLLIGLDVLKPFTRSSNSIIDNYAGRIEGVLKMEARIRDKSEPPCYEWDQMVERLHTSTNKSVDMESCKFLLQRNVKPAQQEPHKYYFSRDSRLKTSLFYAFSQDVSVQMAKRIKCPHLFIKALQGPYFEKKEYFDEVLSILKQNPNFEYHEVEGTHHVHLNDPEKVAKFVNSFLHKWKI